ncbi:hypothetical protein [Paractinoplanes lichenicola]|uniref:Uncharacterized protein n=1 Tax=Paractinoplanes lichenicola TaxID=2802976 RepID=A0ABS1VL15_9ACTN|nr:hypothetical protein [Actinoplanes lichenicola]MBL7254834.1 hypothetical protein [Actinoplanes lichenicola]
MLQLIKSADTDKHYQLLTGWKQSADLINEHRWQVQNYRDNLAAAWPPERNAAAAAYVARLDDLINNLDETYEAAIANHDAFAAATLSISLAQRDMQKIADEYASNTGLLHDYAVQQQAKQNNPTPTPSPSPSGGDQPPVAAGRQEELHRQAVTLLSGVSGELATAQLSIRTPTLYKPSFRDNTKDPNGVTDTFPPPPIPPIVPTYGSDGGGGSTKTRPSVTFPTAGGAVPPPPTPIPTQQPGLILGGANPAAPTFASPSTTPNPLPQTLPGGTGPIAAPGLLPPSISNRGPSSPGQAPPTAAQPGRGAGVPREGFLHTNTAIGGGRPLPPGGVIGGVPGVGLGQPAGSRPQAQRVNPVGGVIGEGPHGRTALRGAPSGEHMAGGMPYGQSAGRRPGKADSAESHWDPDNPWQTDQGVDPVVLPTREQRVDPGPAIGLR